MSQSKQKAFLFLDESGDLGLNFEKQTPRHFTITALLVYREADYKYLRYGVDKTLKRKLKSKKKKQLVHELKATNTTFNIKKYFYTQTKHIPFSIFARTLDKYCIPHRKNLSTENLYNMLTFQVIQDIMNVHPELTQIEVSIDKSKDKSSMRKFDHQLRMYFPQLTLEIYHTQSQRNFALQACDIFCWGIFQKYEQENQDWFSVFAEEKIQKEDILILK